MAEQCLPSAKAADFFASEQAGVGSWRGHSQGTGPHLTKGMFHTIMLSKDTVA